ncbi:hypothetical protein BK145_26380 [Paenibacillus peoriae]|nr:hypothetical protein BK145_26380 [Paenibacillus peoriae]
MQSKKNPLKNDPFAINVQQLTEIIDRFNLKLAILKIFDPAGDTLDDGEDVSASSFLFKLILGRLQTKLVNHLR